MINTLYLPELREMIAEGNAAEMREFCLALHPARTAEFMEGLTAAEAWEVLKHAELPVRQEIFSFFPHDRQEWIIENEHRDDVALLIAEMPPDDRVDLLQSIQPHVVDEVLALLPTDERRDILRLRAYPEGTAGAVMTTDFANLSESLTVQEALEELSRQAEELETVNYLYVVDDADRLQGVASIRQLFGALGQPQTRMGDLMKVHVISVRSIEDQEQVAKKVAYHNLLAIPVIDEDRRILGIITHDDIIDVFREEATEDAHRIAGLAPLEESYLRTNILTLTWKRGVWLTVLFMAALLTAFVLRHYEEGLAVSTWLVLFIPLVISSGGNSGNQTATLIITALATGDVKLKDWATVVRRELVMGLILGGILAACGLLAAFLIEDSNLTHALIVGITLILVVLTGTVCGATLPLLFRKLGLDPALMSNPFVAGIVDILGIVIYMNVALTLLQP